MCAVYMLTNASKLRIDFRTVLNAVKQFDEKIESCNFSPAENKVQSMIQRILTGDDVNRIMFDADVRKCFVKNKINIYVIYKNCVRSKFNEDIQNIAAFIKQSRSQIEIFSYVTQTICATVKRSMIVRENLLHFDKSIDSRISISEYVMMDTLFDHVFCTMINHNDIDKSLINILDENLMEYNLNSFVCIVEFIKCISYYRKYNASDPHCQANAYDAQLINTKKIFYENMNKFSDEVIDTMLQWYYIIEKSNHHIDTRQPFIKEYKDFFEKRLLEKITPEIVEREDHILRKLMNILANNVPKTYNRCSPETITHNKKYIDEMFCQIGDVKLSIQLTHILKNATLTHDRSIIHRTDTLNLTTPNDESEPVIPDLSACSVLVQRKNLWNIDIPIFNMKHNKYIDVCDKIISKIYSFDNNNDTLVLNGDKSTCVLHIIINNSEYNFLATVSQIDVLTTIIDAEIPLSIEDICSMLVNKKRVHHQLSSSDIEYIENILTGICSCELIIENDKKYCINTDFSFGEMNVSLVGLTECDEKIDEEIIFDVLQIITSGKQMTCQQISDEYTKEFGIENFGMIQEVVTYLLGEDMIIKKNILTCEPDSADEEYTYSFNDDKLSEIESYIQ